MGRSSRLRVAVVTAVVVVVAAATSSVAALGSSAAKPKPPNQQSGSFSMVMNLAYKPGFDILIANFNRVYPNIQVNPTYLSVGGSSPYATVVATQFAAGNAPDLIWTVGGRGGPTSTQILAQAGYLDSLDGHPFIKRVPAVAKPDYMVGKHIYASELGTSVLSLITYNKDYFDANKLKIPTTFPQLIQLCQTIAAQGKTPISWGAQTPAVNANNIVALAGGTVFQTDPTWYKKRLAHQTTFAGTPGWQRAVQMVVDMKNAGCFHKGAEAVSFANMANEFASGQAVMLWTVPILLGSVFALNPNIHFGMFPPPVDNAKNTQVTLQPQGGLAINSRASADAKKAALTFIDFMAREKQARLFCKINFLISSFDAQKGKLPDAYAGLAPWFKAGRVINTITTQYPNTQFSTLFGTSAQGLFTGQKSVTDVLADMDKAFDLPPS
jgi:raffinose/stachyose/melibiose transport system substrate-binding protein